ncbi:hypothetical protein GALMADRAFT_148410 [Galerina marginata CBS 339.88]|uniref:Uncharacterized protein n=1 Tax=Galerina marginata (strain CBS 339.88) TaxID=685588 RepID=A0A067SG66_GALM3|nr:hypothetical protein GALMADRAFT_148410 [Galerina marginata CBS 339.88]
MLLARPNLSLGVQEQKLKIDPSNAHQTTIPMVNNDFDTITKTLKLSTAVAIIAKAVSAKPATTRAGTVRAAKSAIAKAMVGKSATMKVAGARAHKVTRTPTPEPALESLLISAFDLNDLWIRWGQTKMIGMNSILYLKWSAPSLSTPISPMEQFTTWRKPGTDDFVPPPPHTVVPHCAQAQFDRAMKYLYPAMAEQGHADDVDADEIVKGVDGKKKKIDKDKRKAVDDKPVDEENLAQERIEDQEQCAWSCEPHEEVIKMDKGKDKKVDVVEDTNCHDVVITMANNQVIINNDASNWGGRPSNLYSDDCNMATVEIEAILDRIVTKHHKKVALVHDNVGYGPVHAECHASSAWVAYLQVYALKWPKPKAQSANDRMSECHDSYFADIEGMSSEELEAFKLKLFDELAKEIAKLPKASIGSRVKAAQKSLSKCIYEIFAKDPEIQIFSGIVYVGEDPVGLQLSGIIVLSSRLMMKVASKLPVNILFNQATGLARGEYSSASIASAVNEGGSKGAASVTKSSTTAKPIKALKVVKTESISVAFKSVAASVIADDNTSYLKFYLEAWTTEEKEFMRGSTQYLRIPLAITNTCCCLLTCSHSLTLS